MTADSTKAMQEALQAAVARLNSGSAQAPAGASDPLSLLMAVLPKLLEDNEENEDLSEKLENLQKGDISQLREQVQMLRKQCHRLLKSQEEILLELREVKKQQSAVNQAVLALARNMERIELIEGASDEEDVYEQDDSERVAEHLSGGQRRRGVIDEPSRMRRKVPRNPSRERP